MQFDMRALPKASRCVDSPPDIDEIALAELQIAPSTVVPPPRIVTAPASFECHALRAVEPGPNQIAVIAELLYAHVRDEFVEDAERR